MFVSFIENLGFTIFEHPVQELRGLDLCLRGSSSPEVVGNYGKGEIHKSSWN